MLDHPWKFSPSPAGLYFGNESSLGPLLHHQLSMTHDSVPFMSDWSSIIHKWHTKILVFYNRFSEGDEHMHFLSYSLSLPKEHIAFLCDDHDWSDVHQRALAWKEPSFTSFVLEGTAWVIPGCNCFPWQSRLPVQIVAPAPCISFCTVAGTRWCNLISSKASVMNVISGSMCSPEFVSSVTNDQWPLTLSQ